MASVLNITPASFKSGLLLIATNKHTEADLQAFIDEYEVTYIEDMLGCDLAALFFADLVAGIPQSPRFLVIFNKFCIDDDNCGKQWKSIGIIEMLKRFIYWEYVRQQKVFNTNTGSVVNENEVSRETNMSESGIFQVYNEGIHTYWAIKWFICDNESDYPEYNGQRKRLTSFL